MQKYHYIPSYVYTTGSKYLQLTKEYQKLFKKFIQNKLSDKEKEKMFFGIYHVTDYVYGSFFYMIKENYNTKTNQEKVITATYNRLYKIHNTKLHQIVYELAEQSVYYALGIEQYKNRNFVWKPDTNNFIKHCIYIYKTLLYEKFKQLTSMLDNTQDNVYTEDEDSLSAEEIVKQSGIDKFLPKEVKEDIIKYLNGESDKKDHIQKYLEIIYKRLYVV